MAAAPVETGLKRRAAVAAAVLAACFGSTTAIAGIDAPGTPGTPGCVGHSQAFFAQLGRNLGDGVGNGVGGLAHSAQLAPQDLHAAAVVNCGVNP